MRIKKNPVKRAIKINQGNDQTQAMDIDSPEQTLAKVQELMAKGGFSETASFIEEKMKQEMKKKRSNPDLKLPGTSTRKENNFPCGKGG